MKIIKTVFIVIFIIVAAFSIWFYLTYFNNHLVSGTFNDVKEVAIQLHDKPDYDLVTEKKLTPAKDGEKIKRLFYELKRAKVKNYLFEGEGPQNDYAFVISIIYYTKPADIIMAGPNPQAVFKVLREKNGSIYGWIKGENKEVLNLILDYT